MSEELNLRGKVDAQKIISKSVVLRVKLMGEKRQRRRMWLCHQIIQFAGWIGGYKRIECSLDVELDK